MKTKWHFRTICIQYTQEQSSSSKGFELNAHIVEKKSLLPACSQTYSFYPLSSDTVPIVTASTPFPIIYILSRGIINSWVDTETPVTACHTCILPGAPSEQGSTKKSLQPAIHTQQHSAGSAVQTACCSHGEWKIICLTSHRLRKSLRCRTK